ncbi:MAG: VOC family protein [Chloroflexales bacterium]|nr:VOC family protein [Chloroflexales bacterium]
MPHLGHVTIVVNDYDHAIDYYTCVLDFVVYEDRLLTPGKRWVLIGPAHRRGSGILLAQATTADQTAHIGNQTGGRVAFFLMSDDFAHDYARMQVLGVTFLEAPRHEAYGNVVKWCDCYGNNWDLLQLFDGNA